MTMRIEPYRPERTVSGPAYGRGFKTFATLLCALLAVIAARVLLREQLPVLGLGVGLLLVGAALMLALTYYWFLRSTVTVDEAGVTQTWMIDRRVEWRDVRSAKLIGVPFMSWLFPPRLVIRTSNAYSTFTGGSQELLVEFARVALAYQMKP